MKEWLALPVELADSNADPCGYAPEWVLIRMTDSTRQRLQLLNKLAQETNAACSARGIVDIPTYWSVDLNIPLIHMGVDVLWLKDNAVCEAEGYIDESTEFWLDEDEIDFGDITDTWKHIGPTENEVYTGLDTLSMGMKMLSIESWVDNTDIEIEAQMVLVDLVIGGPNAH